jgi:hypothetical protein
LEDVRRYKYFGMARRDCLRGVRPVEARRWIQEYALGEGQLSAKLLFVVIASMVTLALGSCGVINEGDFVQSYNDEDDERIWMVVAIDDTPLSEENESETNPGTCRLVEFERLHEDGDGEYFYGAIGGKSAATFDAPCVDYEEVDPLPENLWWDAIPDEHLGVAGYEDVFPDGTPTPTAAAAAATPMPAPAMTALGAMERVFVVEQLFELTESIYPVQVTNEVRVGDKGLSRRWEVFVHVNGKGVKCDARVESVSCTAPYGVRLDDVGSSIWGVTVDSDEIFPAVRASDERWVELLAPDRKIRVVLEHFVGEKQPRWYGGITLSRTSVAQFDWLLDSDRVLNLFD